MLWKLLKHVIIKVDVIVGATTSTIAKRFLNDPVDPVAINEMVGTAVEL